ncbi:MAG: histidine--tRNA ligase [Nitrospiraceae bacterium]|nr:histidine--tRNA ligase [Nitrospiraceae bacterium]
MSSGRYQALKGMKDIMPPDIHVWQSVERKAREVFSAFGFREIRPPIVEATGVFTRSIGENTDIVEKEMYTFEDKGGRSITLRPEGTAPVVRCYVENHLYNMPPPQKFYYAGPMFRYERPQSGRFRQFYQIGAECFGSPHPAADAEMLSMLRHFLSGVGLPNLKFQVNSIGCENCRPAFKDSLVAFFAEKIDDLCADCRRRYGQNPLRILDCKVEGCREARKGAPRVTDHLCEDCRVHFEHLLLLLEKLGIPHSVNPEMVRGLDYYTRTTFEVTSENLGAQNAVAAGGRYDRLVKEFGGPETPAVGFAIGMERVVELLKAAVQYDLPRPLAFLAMLGKQAGIEGVLIADRVREKGLWVELGDAGSSLKSQMRRADRLNAQYVFIAGDDELRAGSLKWKRLSDSAEGEVAIQGVVDFLQSLS